jgi:hypothetical protein
VEFFKYFKIGNSFFQKKGHSFFYSKQAENGQLDQSNHRPAQPMLCITHGVPEPERKGDIRSKDKTA